MGITVLDKGANRIKLGSPFDRNINHKNTAFGGSSSSLAILSCWTIIHVRLESEITHFHLVIQKSEMEYQAPVTGDFSAECEITDEKSWKRFINSLKKFGKGRISLQSIVMCNGKITCQHTGTYVAVTEPGA